jgi:hypothetical protein
MSRRRLGPESSGLKPDSQKRTGQPFCFTGPPQNAETRGREQNAAATLVLIAALRGGGDSRMKHFVKAGLVAAAVLASATAALAMPTVPANVLASGDGDPVIQVKGGHGHGHGHMGHHGGRGHHYGWGRGRGHHYGWSRRHHRH